MSGYFAEDAFGWDQETGKPGIITFGTALQVWALFNHNEKYARKAKDPVITVAEAALAFCCPPQMIVEAVNDHCWMFLEGPQDDFTKLTIEHDGE